MSIEHHRRLKELEAAVASLKDRVSKLEDKRPTLRLPKKDA